ncbi:hypothetical protein [Aeromonas salmonicida]|uniref:hypothetical protein n=1 Tax=Aeromonas salmonicida TaxID=645 RepID=UPI003D1C416A
MEMVMKWKVYTALTEAEALAWLVANDPEYDWASERADENAMRNAIADNLADFGERVQTGEFLVLLTEPVSELFSDLGEFHRVQARRLFKDAHEGDGYLYQSYDGRGFHPCGQIINRESAK